MIEIFLIVGVIFVIGLVVLMHIGSTIEFPMLQEFTDIPADPSLHPWFLAVETILAFVIIYLVQHIS